MSVLSKPYFHDEAAAFAFVEAALWNGESVCPHCGCVGRVYALANVRGSKSKANPEGAIRHGLKKCGDCRKQFTVRVGTIFEESHLPMTKWLQAIYLLCSSKKGISAKQLERTLEVTYKTAWFLAHRIREAMRSGELAPFGGNGTPVEVDETFIGHDPDYKGARAAYQGKIKILALVDRETGRAKSMVVDRLTIAEIAPILDENIASEARLMTDEAGLYKSIGWNFADHGVVTHSRDEYVSKQDRTIHTNTIEGFFSIFKRGMKGVYQHASKKHMHRYLAEFDFRYSNRIALGVDDIKRAERALQGVVGKRLTYQTTNRRAEA